MHTKRLIQLEELLEIEYTKLSEFQKEIAITASAPTKFELQQRLRREVLPNICRHEVEYAELLSEQAKLDSISETDARNILSQVVQAVEYIESVQTDEQPNELRRLLIDIRAKLDEPGKPAAAKLKVILPIIPPIVFYEIQMDTEGFMVRVWRRAKLLLGGRV